MNPLFAAGGEMGALMATIDWSGTSIGPPETWPASLRTAVGVCLESRFPMLLWWGERLTMLYNDAYRPMLGASKHPQAMGADGADMWPEVWDVIGPMLYGVLRDGRATWSDDQLLLLDRNGYLEECYFTFSYSPIRGGDGAVAGVFTAVFETTERVISARRLRLVSALATATLDIRSEEEVLRSAAEVLAADPPDVPFSRLYLLQPPNRIARLALAAGTAPAYDADIDLDDRGGLSAAIAEVVAAQRAVMLERGSVVALPVRARGSSDVLGVFLAGLNQRRALDDGYRQFLELVVGSVATAIADARASEHERERAAALEALNQAKTQFFQNISHEFRTPLTLLLGPLDDALLDTSAPLAPRQRERVAVAHRNALRLRRLVNALLDLARAEGGRTQPRWQPVALDRLTGELASAFQSAIEDAGLTLEVECHRLSQPVVVDVEQWEKILLNLLSNALKHTWEGTITVRLREVGDGVVLEVSDTGSGVPAADVPHLFERFHRVQGARARSHEGTGIGLALVADLVSDHDGTIEVDSEEGAGSTFTVRLPWGHDRADPDALPAAAEDQQPQLPADYLADALTWSASSDLTSDAEMRGATSGAAARPRVLVAEDNADMRHYVTRLLETHYDVETVRDGSAALARALETPPDLILSDVMMPGLDGVELLRRLRDDERTARLPIVLLSARAGDADSIHALETGADDYLVKPFSARELVSRVRANLELGALREQATRAAEERYAAEHAIVEEVQRSLLPQRLPQLTDALTASRYMPASPQMRVGGDWYDIVNLSDELSLIVVGDVVGHGVAAAATMAQLRTATQAFASNTSDPTKLIDCVSTLVRQTGVGFGSTMLAVVIDHRSGEIRAASAGHLQAMIVASSGTTRALAHDLHPPLGLPSERTTALAADRLANGETLVMYTDGLVERRTEPIDSRLAHLCAVSHDPSDGPDQLLDAISSHMGVTDQRDDDVALIALQRITQS